MECRRGLGWSAKQAPLLNQRREWVQDTMSGSLSLARRSSAALASYLHDSIRGSRVEPSRSRRRNPRCERKQRPEGVGPKKSGKAISPKANSCRSRNGDAELRRANMRYHLLLPALGTHHQTRRIHLHAVPEGIWRETSSN